jgi:hypothetical protein
VLLTALMLARATRKTTKGLPAKKKTLALLLLLLLLLMLMLSPSPRTF